VRFRTLRAGVAAVYSDRGAFAGRIVRLRYEWQAFDPRGEFVGVAASRSGAMSLFYAAADGSTQTSTPGVRPAR
jgi:hypothetical protein